MQVLKISDLCVCFENKKVIDNFSMTLNKGDKSINILQKGSYFLLFCCVLWNTNLNLTQFRIF